MALSSHVRHLKKLFSFCSVLKHFDTVVKEYSGQLSNILTALTCAFFFPDKFQITSYIVASLMLLFSGIYIYETYKPDQRQKSLERKKAQ
jgi:hypothetical protein